MRTKILLSLVLAVGIVVSCTQPSPDGNNSKADQPPAKIEVVPPKPPAKPAVVPPPQAPPLQVKRPMVKLVPGKNILINPGFEKDRKGWTYPDWSQAWARDGFEISKTFSRSGKKSARLMLSESKDVEGTKIRGVVLETKEQRFPDLISGYYYVKDWRRGAKMQYLQMVVIVWQQKYNFPNHQIRYILEGVNTQPYNMRNAHYIFLNGPRKEPETGKWIPFETNVLQDFQEKWKETPKDYEKFMVFFEARYDSKEKGTDLGFDVYYDDLFVGYEKK